MIEIANVGTVEELDRLIAEAKARKDALKKEAEAKADTAKLESVRLANEFYTAIAALGLTSLDVEVGERSVVTIRTKRADAGQKKGGKKAEAKNEG
jgi:hypothetical protein